MTLKEFAGQAQRDQADSAQTNESAWWHRHPHVGLNHIRAAKETGAAMRILENELELLRAVPFNTLQPTEEPQPFRGEWPGIERLVDSFAQTRIAAVEGHESALREVDVQLSWNGHNGRRISKNLITFIAHNGGGG